MSGMSLKNRWPVGHEWVVNGLCGWGKQAVDVGEKNKDGWRLNLIA